MVYIHVYSPRPHGLAQSSTAPCCKLHGRRLLLSPPVRSAATSSEQKTYWTVKPATQKDEFEAVAQLRADAFYEEERSRFRVSYIKKFKSQEADSLSERTQFSGKRPPLCECLVALDEGNMIVGTLDLRPPAHTNEGLAPVGVPSGELEAAYILNVVVAIDRRGEGIGRAIMEEAIKRATTRWAAKSIFTHVAGDNEVARKLYISCGFALHSLSQGATGSGDGLGSMILMKR